MIMAAALIVSGTVTAAAADNSKKDSDSYVIEQDEYFSDSQTANGMEGDGETATSDDRVVSRLAVTEEFYKISGETEISGGPAFSDTDSAYVLWAYKNEIASGFGDGTFKPDEPVNREQLAVMVYNYVRYTGGDVSNIEGMAIYNFSDYPEISDWALTAVRYCLNSAVISGNDDMTYNPKGYVSVSELSEILLKIKK